MEPPPPPPLQHTQLPLAITSVGVGRTVVKDSKVRATIAGQWKLVGGGSIAETVAGHCGANYHCPCHYVLWESGGSQGEATGVM